MTLMHKTDTMDGTLPRSEMLSEDETQVTPEIVTHIALPVQPTLVDEMNHFIAQRQH